MPKISIIIPVYNTEKYLCECLDSVLSQTLQEIEIIVVNDASCGNCDELIQQYCDQRIQYIRHERNMGTAQARISGFSRASGEFILSLDSDDSITADACASIYDALKHSAAKICYIGALLYQHPNKEDVAKDSEVFSPQSAILSVSEWAQMLVTAKWNNCLTLYVVERSLFQQVVQKISTIASESRLVYLEDFLFVFALSALVQGQIVAIPKQVYEYRLGTGIMNRENTVTLVAKKLQNSLLVYRTVNSLLRESPTYSTAMEKTLEERFLQDDICELLSIYISSSQSDRDKINAYLEEKRCLRDFVFFLVEHERDYEMERSSSQELQQDRWYRFGQLSRKRKLWVLARALSKKFGMYRLLRPLAKVLKRILEKT